MKRIWEKRKWLCLLFSVLACFLLVWCGGWSNKDELVLNVWNFELEYAWNVKLSKVALKTDDLDEIIDLYQEEWDDIWYRDSLLIAQKYSQWLWINTFAQENLDVLEDQWLILSNVNKKQIILGKGWEKINVVLVEYEIVEWLIPEIPKLYLSQLFIPEWSNVWLISFITENPTLRNNVSKTFQKIK